MAAAQAVTLRKAVGLDACLVLVETLVGHEARHAYVDAGLARLVIGIGFAESRLVQHIAGKLDDVNVIVMSALGAWHLPILHECVKAAHRTGSRGSATP